MKELVLKYGCNPNQSPSKIFMANGEDLPLEVISGRPGYINFLDALNSWQLVKELKIATGKTAAASFKHVSPAGAALGLPLDETEKKVCFVDDIENLNESAVACAYARARGCDRMSSYGDFIALSDECDEITAKIIEREVSDGVIAPSYSKEALEILTKKRKGNYNVIKIDKDYDYHGEEQKQVFGITFSQKRNDCVIDGSLFEEIPTKNKNLTAEAKDDLILGLIALKYTQSNSVCYAYHGQTIGVGAGQQSRIHCTRLAGNKADLWHLRHHPRTLSLAFLPEVPRPDRNNLVDLFVNGDDNTPFEESNWQKYFSVKPAVLTSEEKQEYLLSKRGASLASDAFFPFDDNIERAYRSGVDYISQPGGSIRDDIVIQKCDELGIVMAFSHLRLFTH